MVSPELANYSGLLQTPSFLGGRPVCITLVQDGLLKQRVWDSSAAR